MCKPTSQDNQIYHENEFTFETKFGTPQTENKTQPDSSYYFGLNKST